MASGDLNFIQNRSIKKEMVDLSKFSHIRFISGNCVVIDLATDPETFLESRFENPFIANSPDLLKYLNNLSNGELIMINIFDPVNNLRFSIQGVVNVGADNLKTHVQKSFTAF
jgi:hypothetical protein